MNVKEKSEIIFEEWFEKLSCISSEEWDLFKKRKESSIVVSTERERMGNR